MSEDKPLVPPSTLSEEKAEGKPLPGTTDDPLAPWRPSPEKKIDPQQVCNIGPDQRLRRYFVGGFLLLVSICLSFLLIHFGAHWLLRLWLFVPFWLTFVCLFQAGEKVCVLHARRGTRDMGKGVEPVTDPQLASKIRMKATWIYYKAAYAALFWTLLAVIVQWSDR
jgi:hypothetical protein